MKNFLTRVITTLALLGAATVAQAASDFVLIDQGDPAYTVYAGFPESRAADIKSKITNQPVQLVSFKEFADLPTKFIGERIVNDDYAGLRAQEGLVELVRKYPGTPFGITWNGGIAFTRSDYQFAKQQFANFGQDPEAYRRTRRADVKTDPINPMSHLGPLLGW